MLCGASWMKVFLTALPVMENPSQKTFNGDENDLVSSLNPPPTVTR